jgi:hypothetical protein
MKTSLKFVSLLIVAAIMAMPVFGQQTEKELKKEIKDKAIKDARKEAKNLKKQGFYVPPGSLPLDKLVERSWMKQYSEDEMGNQRYITADGNAVAQSKSAAEMQAIELGKLQLAGLIQSNMNSLISANVGNAQLSTDDAASVTEIVQSAKNIIATELGYVDPAFKLYRDIKKDKVEVQVRLFYDVKQSLEIAKKVVQKEVKDKLKINEEQLNKLMGLD